MFDSILRLRAAPVRHRIYHWFRTMAGVRWLGQSVYLATVITLALSTEALGQTCHQATILNPTPFMGNGDEIIQLDDGSYWKEVSYQYLFLFEFFPSVTICPRSGVLRLDDYEFTVVAVECRTDFIQEPTPFMGNGGELIRLGDGTIWKDSSYLYLYLYEYNPSVVICPDEGILQVGENQFTVSQVIPGR